MLKLQPPEWWVRVPVLTGPVLHLREVEVTDAEALFELLTDPAVREHVNSPPPTVAAFQGFVAWAQRQRVEGECVCFAVIPHGLKEPVGLFQVRALQPKFFSAEWGFAIAPAFWATGVFEEAARLVATFAFDALGVHRLEARAVTANGRGNGALQKLGACDEAVLRGSFRRDGRAEEQFLWTLIADEWKAQPIRSRTVFEVNEARRRVQRAVAQLPAPVRNDRSRGSPSEPFAYPFFLTDDPPEDS